MTKGTYEVTFTQPIIEYKTRHLKVTVQADNRDEAEVEAEKLVWGSEERYIDWEEYNGTEADADPILDDIDCIEEPEYD